MEAIDRSEYPVDRVKRLLSGVPFFNEVLRGDGQQFDQLLNCSEILLARPGETVIAQGDSDTYLYFLLSGQLAVMGANPDGSPLVLNYISPGEVFGALAMIMGTPRTATIKVDDSAREAVVARLDYSHFRNLQESSVFNLATRLSFYRMLAHNIRWTLEVNKMQNPEHPLVANLRTVPIYTGPKGSQAELEALHEQSMKLADILCQWNQSSEPVQKSNIQVT